MMMFGIFSGYFNGCIYLLVIRAFPLDSDENFLKRNISLIMMLYGLSGMLMSYGMKALSATAQVNVIKFTGIGFAFVLIIVQLFPVLVQNLALVIVIAVIMGATEVSFNISINVYLSTHFKGLMEAFTLFQQFNNIILSLFIVAFIGMNQTLFGYLLSVACLVLAVLNVNNFKSH